MISPEVWGPRYWYEFHTTAFTYPARPRPDHQVAVKNYYESLQYLLPCDACKAEYGKLLQRYPLDPALVSGKTLSEWAVQVHNAVNQRLGKPQMSLEEATSIWTNPNHPIHRTASLAPRTGSLANLPKSAFQPPQMTAEQRKKGMEGWQWLILVGGILIVLMIAVVLMHKLGSVKKAKTTNAAPQQPLQLSQLEAIPFSISN